MCWSATLALFESLEAFRGFWLLDRYSFFDLFYFENLVGAALRCSNQRGSRFQENTRFPGKSEGLKSRSWRLAISFRSGRVGFNRCGVKG